MLCKSESIAQLSLDSMVIVLRSPDLHLRSELDVIHTMIWWLIGKGSIAKGAVARLLPIVNLCDS